MLLFWAFSFAIGLALCFIPPWKFKSLLVRLGKTQRTHPSRLMQPRFKRKEPVQHFKLSHGLYLPSRDRVVDASAVDVNRKFKIGADQETSHPGPGRGKSVSSASGRSESWIKASINPAVTTRVAGKHFDSSQTTSASSTPRANTEPGFSGRAFFCVTCGLFYPLPCLKSSFFLSSFLSVQYFSFCSPLSLLLALFYLSYLLPSISLTCSLHPQLFLLYLPTGFSDYCNLCT